MNQMLSSIQNLSNTAKIGVAAAGGGGLVAALAMFGWNRTAMAVILAGLVLVALLLVLYRQVLKLLAKRKAAPMTQALASSAAAAPQGISDPARRARLDDLRKNFENGVEKFRAAGKNIYSLPWYLLVGEPGSGKTEAVRHCNVGFPPGLQDQLQGAGGTINMNWWFTNHAVILDTAGRLMFEEVEPGSSSEWQEFLKLLRKTRPNCPVNGMLLVIPAESLIKDTADSIERKGGKIAQQLDQIQRALGVRFPVFVVITKCDLINGFREFFDDMKDPQLQHQILGWSNPAPLDEPFNAEQIEKHLESVQRRLVRRRLGLMLDPVNREDPTARRTDEVDALFAFPEAMVKIAPRLRRYLEMIFVAGVWSAKPLFLRGIYFTSSMREGSALDADLAEALGMPVESLPEGRVWERDRAYFLRDLFISKIFREQGLVTRAVNTKAQQRQRRMVVMGAAGVGALLLAAFTYLGSSGLNRDIVAPKEFWSQTKEAYARGSSRNFIDGAEDYYQAVLSRRTANSEVFDYDGALKSRFEEFAGVPEELRRVGRFPEQLRRSASASVSVPWVFLPIAVATGDTRLNLAESERREAARVLIEASVVRPLIDAAAERMRVERDRDLPWTPQATAALAQLVRMETARAAGRTPEGGIQVAPLLAYAVMGGEQADAYSPKEAEALQDVVDWVYKRGGAALPPAGSRPLDARLAGAVRAFQTSWSHSSPSAEGLADVMALVRALRALGEAEAELLRIADQFAAPADYGRAYDQWVVRYGALSAAAQQVDAGVGALAGRTLVEAHRAELARFRERAEAAHRLLLDELEPVAPAEGERQTAQAARYAPLRELRSSLEENLARVKSADDALAALQQEIAAMEALFIAKTPAGDPSYQARVGAYAVVNALFGEAGAQDLTLGEFGPRLEEVRRAVAGAKAEASQRLPRASGSGGAGTASPMAERAERAQRLCTLALDVAEKRINKALVLRLTAVAPENVDRFGEAVARHAEARRLTVARPQVLLSRAAREQQADFEHRFSPGAAAALLLDFKRAGEAVGEREGESSILETAQREAFGRSSRVAADYQALLASYWRDGHLQQLRVTETGWEVFRDVFAGAPQGFVFNTPLSDVAKAMMDAAALLEPVLTAQEVSAIRTRAETTSRFLAEPTFTTTCDRVLAAWSRAAVSSAVSDARIRILDAVRAGRFDEDYVAAASTSISPSSENFAAEFWSDLCLQAMVSLRVAAEQETKKACEQLRIDSAFPLKKPSDRAPMEPDSVVQARNVVSRIVMRSAGGEAGQPAVLSKFPRFAEELRLLSGPGLLAEEEREWLGRVEGVLRALPEGDERELPVRISVIFGRPPQRGTETVEFRMQTFGVTQGSGPCRGELRPRLTADQKPVSIVLPGEGVRFCFFTNDRPDTPAATREFRPKWSALQMLHELEAQPTREGGNKVWEAELIVPYGEEKLSMWLRLEFEKPVPALNRWPE